MNSTPDHISPSIGEFAVQECARLKAVNAELVAILTAMNHMVGDYRGGYCICVLHDGSAEDRRHASHCADARAAIAKAQS